MNQTPSEETKFCKFCGEKIPFDAVLCTKCGRQVEKLENETPISINNVVTANANASTLGTPNIDLRRVRKVKKWTAFLLCIFGGFLGLHKFYEGKTFMGVVYLFTLGLVGFGWIIDTIIILLKPNPYEVCLNF